MVKDNIKIPGSEKFREKKAKVGEIEINYAEAGTGNAQTIVAVHGWTNNWTGFIPVGLELKEKYRVILMDLPGYGDSGRLKKYSVEIEADYVKKFTEKLELKNYYLMGHSMGTFVVAKFLEKYPKAAKGAVMIGAVFRKGNKEKILKIWKKFYSLANKSRKLEGWLKRVVDYDWYSHLTSKYVNMYRYDREIVQNYGIIGKKKMSKEVYVQLGAEITGEDIERMIGKNEVPILLIYGKYDKLCGLEQAKRALEGKGSYQFAEVDEGGHIVTVERPKEVAEEIKRFIIGCGSAV